MRGWTLNVIVVNALVNLLIFLHTRCVDLTVQTFITVLLRV